MEQQLPAKKDLQNNRKNAYNFLGVLCLALTS
jgi:hypothetical protein